MASASVAVTLAAWRNKQRAATYAFGLITLIFLYTTVVNIIERPEGLQIAGLFILAIVVVSLISRIFRTTELRVQRFEFDPVAQRYIDEAARGTIRIIANRKQAGDEREYVLKERDIREDNLIPPQEPVLFLEVEVCDPSEFTTDVMEIKGVEVAGYRILRAESSAVPNAIAAFLLYLRDRYGKLPHCYFSWAEGNPLLFLFRYLILGRGDTAPVTREIIREHEPDPERRPGIHVG
jgi:hypothetical protein